MYSVAATTLYCETTTHTTDPYTVKSFLAHYLILKQLDLNKSITMVDYIG